MLYDEAYNKVLEHLDLPNQKMISWLRGHCRVAELVAIEMVEFQGQAVGQSTFHTCRWIGRFEQVCLDQGVAVRLIGRGRIIIHHCGRRQGCGDPHVTQAVKDRFPQTGGGKDPVKGIKKQPGPCYGMKGHEWQALACAMCNADTYQKGAPLLL